MTEIISVDDKLYKDKITIGSYTEVLETTEDLQSIKARLASPKGYIANAIEAARQLLERYEKAGSPELRVLADQDHVRHRVKSMLNHAVLIGSENIFPHANRFKYPRQ